MAAVVMYCTAACPYCQSAERLLVKKGVRDLHKIRVDLAPARRAAMMPRSGRGTVPQIWIGERHIGGFDDLPSLARRRGLGPLPHAAQT